MPLWQVVTPTAEMSSLVISTLAGKRSPWQLWTAWHTPPIGEIGHLGADASTSTPSSLELPGSNMPTCSWLLLPESVLTLLVTANKLGASPSPRHCVMLPKPLFWSTEETPVASDLYSAELGLAFTRLYHCTTTATKTYMEFKLSKIRHELSTQVGPARSRF